MEKSLLTKHKNKIGAGVLAAGVGLAALTGCSSGNKTPDWVAPNSTLEYLQYSNDGVFDTDPNSEGFYAYNSNKSDAERACTLHETGYGETGYDNTNGAAIIVVDPSNHVMSVYPADSKQAPVLRLTGFDGNYSTPLAPADAASQNILDTYHCQHLPLENIPE